MTGKTHVLIRDTKARKGAGLYRVTLAAVPAFMLGRVVLRYQYAAGDRWHHFEQTDAMKMRGEVEARLAEIRAESAKGGAG